MNTSFKRWDLINYLIKEFRFSTYLEIGVQSGMCFSKINCSKKVGVDPDKTSRATIHKTSDDFFEENKETFDIVFIDGLHEADQVKKDIKNALNVLNKDGFIICHDMLPTTEEAQQVPRIQSVWNGDCWKAFVRLRSENANLTMATLNHDHGLGIILKGRQTLLDNVPDNLEYSDFVKNKQEYMNIISLNDFMYFCGILKSKMSQ